MGGAVAAGADASKNLVSRQRTLEQEHSRLSAALNEQEKKFLVVIDDIDRLGTEDALQMFRLVKSVGRLPNVIYLLAFDRLLAESMIAERFPSEGPCYLEKIIQGAFDLPLPDPDDLMHTILKTVEQVMGSPPEPQMQRFWNLFYEIVAPFIRTPRDAIRLGNAIRVSWPAVSEDADRTDFLALETIRLFLPRLHTAIRSHPDMLCGVEPGGRGSRDGISERYEAVFLSGLNDRETQIARQALFRLFPRMQSVWSNMWHSESHREWKQERLVCSETHFPTYFTFSVPEGAITSAELRELLQAAGNAERIAEVMRRMASQTRRRGGTRASLALEELSIWADKIPTEDLPELFKGLFSVADEINIKADERQAFSIGDNPLRIHWVLNRTLRERFDQEERSEIIETACQNAALGWLLDISVTCMGHHAREETNDREPAEPLVTMESAQRLRDLSVRRVQANSSELLKQRELLRMLHNWKHLSDASEVRRWTDTQMVEERFIVLLAENFVHRSWSQGLGIGGLGDVMPKKNEYLNTRAHAEIVDIERFKRVVNELLERNNPALSPEDRAILERFEATPERDEQGRPLKPD